MSSFEGYDTGPGFRLYRTRGTHGWISAGANDMTAARHITRWTPQSAPSNHIQKLIEVGACAVLLSVVSTSGQVARSLK